MNRTRPVSCYEILQVTPQSSDDDIKRAYRRLALRHHPDRNPRNRHLAELRFRLITEAYSTIRTSERRAQYDLSLRPKNDNRRASWLGLMADIFKPAGNTERTRA